MLRIITLNWKNYCGRGVDYTNRLYDMVLRNLPEGFPGTFTVFSDTLEAGYTPGIDVRALPERDLSGWWNKLALFKDGYFNSGDRILYLDLDTIITGPLDEIATYAGPFAILRDFYRPKGLQSSVMAWEANTQGHIWRHYDGQDYAGGDQAWIEKCFEVEPDIWQRMFPGSFCSYKEHARYGIPRGTKVCVFHGDPRPHEVAEDWVPEVWRIGGGTSAELVIEPNIPLEQISAQVKSALTRDAKWLGIEDAHDGVALICAGGPSLKTDMETVRHLATGGAKVFTANGAYTFLANGGIRSDYQVILDGREENIVFVPETTAAQQIYSSQCHPSVLDAATNLTLWHPYFDGIIDIVGKEDQSAFIGGGTTAGLKAVAIAFTLGFRKIHMFGFDSCYQGAENHAYVQKLNDGERVLDVKLDGKNYRAAPWMVTQAEDFEILMPELVSMGAEIYVHGDGLIPDMAKYMGSHATLLAPDLRASAILSRLEGVSNPVGAEIGVFAGDLSKRLLSRTDLKLYLVDSWASEHQPAYAESGDFHATLTQAQQDKYYEHTRSVVSFAAKRATIIRKPSVRAAADVADDALDFVFIDADHSYDGCKADIAAWLPKVRAGGVIGGHDYDNTDFPCFGVKKAVDEFIAEFGLTLELGENFTWFATKQRMAA